MPKTLLPTLLECFSRKYSKGFHTQICKYFVQMLHVLQNVPSLKLLAYSCSQVLKQLTFHLLRQTGKDLVPHMVQLSFRTPRREKKSGLVSFILGRLVEILHQI